MSTITIWLDLLEECADLPKAKTVKVVTHLSLSNVDPYLITYRNLDKCFAYVTTLPEDGKNVILIISKETTVLCANIIRLINLSQIHFVYILCSNDFNADEILEVSNKILGIFSHSESLYQYLRQIPRVQRGQHNERFTRMYFNIDAFASAISDQTSVRVDDSTTNGIKLSPMSSQDTMPKRQEPEFMYAQFLRDILIDMKSSEEEMIAFFRQKYAGNQTELDRVNEFEAYYEASNAIFWYIRDTFLYRLLNRAIREQEMGTLYAIRHFIKNLHFQLKDRHVSHRATTEENNTPNNMTTETVFRGQLINSVEFDKKLKHNTGGFFSVSNFLSTTSHENLASIYAGNVSSNELLTVQSVIFRIDIDKSVNKFPYANISSESAFGEVENEILFTMGAVFRILSLEFDNEQCVWKIHLKLTGEEDKELRVLSENLRKEIFKVDALYSLARLMMKIGNYTKAQEYYRSVIKDLSQTNNYDSLSCVILELGSTYEDLGELDEAIDFYHKALEVKLEHSSSIDYGLAKLYSALGAAYYAKRDYGKALKYFTQALDVGKSLPEIDQYEISEFYNNIASANTSLERYSEALDMYKICLEHLSTAVPANHPAVADIYGNISSVHLALGNYTKAYDYINRALQIQLYSLPSNHPSLAITYNSVAQVYSGQGNSDKAIESYKKSLQIQVAALPPDHLTLATIYSNFALLLYNECKLQEPLEYMKKAYEINVKKLPSDHLSIYDNLKFIDHLEKELALFQPIYEHIQSVVAAHQRE